jgi:hypothetical protein
VSLFERCCGLLHVGLPGYMVRNVRDRKPVTSLFESKTLFAGGFNILLLQM